MKSPENAVVTFWLDRFRLQVFRNDDNSVRPERAVILPGKTH
jgi:hypothetical protein